MGKCGKSEDLHGDNIGKEYMMDGRREGGEGGRMDKWTD